MYSRNIRTYVCLYIYVVLFSWTFPDDNDLSHKMKFLNISISSYFPYFSLLKCDKLNAISYRHSNSNDKPLEMRGIRVRQPTHIPNWNSVQSQSRGYLDWKLIWLSKLFQNCFRSRMRNSLRSFCRKSVDNKTPRIVEASTRFRSLYALRLCVCGRKYVRWTRTICA